MMKKLTLLLLILLCLQIPTYGQEEGTKEGETPAKPWTLGGQGTLTFNQVALFNWAAGGNSNMTLIGNLNLFANYKKGKITGENTLNLAYGLIKDNFIYNWQGPITKAEDNIDFTSKWGMKAWSEKADYTLLFNYRSQFAPGFAQPGDSLFISKFMAPGYINLSIGLDFKPVKGLSVFVSPISFKNTLVLHDRLANEGAFGVNQRDDNGDFRPGNSLYYRFEAGARVFAKYKGDFWKDKLGYETTLELFSNYIDRPQNIDVRWTNALVVKVTNWLTVNLFTDLIYDKDIMIGLLDAKGNPILIESGPDAGQQEKGPRVQFKEVFGLGLTYKFSTKKEEPK